MLGLSGGRGEPCLPTPPPSWLEVQASLTEEEGPSSALTPSGENSGPAGHARGLLWRKHRVLGGDRGAGARHLLTLVAVSEQVFSGQGQQASACP